MTNRSVQDRLAERAAVHAQMPKCHKHPTEVADWCAHCRDEHHRQEIAKAREAAYGQEVTAVTRDLDHRFPARYRCATANHATLMAWVEAAAKSRSRAGGLLLLGATGTGKTHQAYGALRLLLPRTVEWIENPRTGRGHWTPASWRAMTYADLNASMRPNGSNDPEAVLKANRDADILFIDDLAAVRTSEWAEEHLYRLINGRYEAMRPTIFTTNLDPSALRDTVGDRIASRLVESCARIVIEGPDLRRTGIERPEVCPVHGVRHGDDYSPIGGDTAPDPVPGPRPFWDN